MVTTYPAEIVEALTPQVSTQEQIASLAYALWLERGCPEGSPETDWFLAEQELLTKTAKENSMEPQARREIP